MAPSDVRPQLAKPPTKTSIQPAEAAANPEWIVERKWDGMRALFHVLPDQGETLIFSRTGEDLTEKFPDLLDIHRHFEYPAILDGEIVAHSLDETDKEDLERLQLRLNHRTERWNDIPVEVVFFDVLAAILGESQTKFDGSEQPLAERLDVLSLLLVDTPFHMPEFLESAWCDGCNPDNCCGDCSRFEIPSHWEGVVVKRYDSLYQCGKRNSDWIKHKATLRATLRATGLTPGKGSRADHFGAVEVEDENGVFRGQVGSGFSDIEIEEIESWGNWWLHSEKKDWPLIEVEYRFLSKTGLLVNTAYKGHRPDKENADAI